MVMVKRTSRILATLVVFMLLWASAAPVLGAGPSGDGDDGEGSDQPLDRSSPISIDEEGDIPVYTILEGPEDVNAFGSSVTNLGDIDGDGLDDLITATGYGWLEWDGRPPPDVDPFWPGYPETYQLMGREDRTYNASQLDEVGNWSSTWYYHAERWLGDVNGDGHVDMVCRGEQYVRYDDDGSTEPVPVPWQTYNTIMVHYGTEDGLPDEPDLVIDITPEGLPNGTYISFSFGGVGDVNGDGFNDLFVYRNRIEIWEEPPRPGDGTEPGKDPDRDPNGDPDEPWEYPRVIMPADFQLFYGSEDGLPSEFSYNVTPVIETDYWYVSGVYHADLNGDGHSDIILTSTSVPHVAVYHGSDDGVSAQADRTISFSQQFTYGWHLSAPVDVNGDQYEDLIIDYGQTEGLFDYVQYVYIFEGSSQGIPVTYSSSFKLKSEANARVVMSDINGDGLDDVVIHSYDSGTYDDGKMDLKIQVHFNSGDGFPISPNWQHTFKDYEGESVGMSDGGDFDGDGYGDVVIGAPGYAIWRQGQVWEQTGSLIFIHGAGIMDMLRPLKLYGGPVLYAGYQAYDFRVNVNPTGGIALADIVTLTLDPEGANAVVEWNNLIDSTSPFYVVSGEDLIVLESTWEDTVFDTANNTIWVHFRVLFDWSWPHEEMCDVKVGLTIISNTTTPFVSRDLFRVENDLAFKGELTASGEHQGDLEPGDWVRSGERVTVSGPVVVYEGTTDLYPPSGVCNVALQDNDGDMGTAALVSGEPVSVSLIVDEATDIEESLSLVLTDLPGEASLVSPLVFPVGVDGDSPTFTNAVPEPDDWHSSSQVMVSITADDRPTSGTDAATLEYSYSTDGGATYTDWSRMDLETTSSGPTVDGLVEITFPDGDDNYVRWRARDLVGNDYSVSDALRVKVDTMNVTYSGAIPDPDAWQRVLEVVCGVTIRDMEGAGIDVSTVQFRVSTHNLSAYGDWKDWDEGGQGDAQQVSVTQLVSLAETPFNYVQWRAIDIAGNGYTTSPHYRIRVDATPIAFSDFAPTEPQATSQVEVWITASDGPLGSMVDLSSIMYLVVSDGVSSEWAPVGMTGKAAESRFSVLLSLNDGDDHQVSFQGLDVAGNGPATSDAFAVVVDTTGPAFGDVSPAPDEKQPGTEVTVSVTVGDAIVGVNATTVMYRYSTQGESGLKDDWQTVTAVLQGDGSYKAELSLTLVPGKDNVVQFKAMDLLGNGALTEVAVIWVNRMPAAAIESPTSDVLYMEGEEVLLSANGTSDPDGDELNYTWWAENGLEPVGYGKLLSALLVPGTYNLTLVVRDDVGAEDTVGVLITVEEFIPPRTSDGDNGWWLIIVILIAAVGAAAGYYAYRRRRTFEPVE